MRKITTTIQSLFLAAVLAVGCSGQYDAPPPVEGGGNGGGKNPDVSDEYDVFLLIGQSNMAGRGTMIAGDTEVFDSNVYLLDDKGNPVPATNPLNQYSSIKKDGANLQQIGPGFSFSKELTKATGRKVLLVVNARGGSNINEWKVGSTFYTEAVRRAKQAQQYGHIKAILWHQGESNSSNPSSYLDNLEPIANGLRKELGITTAPFIAGEIARWHANEAKFNPVIRQISTKISNSDYVSSEGCTWLKDATDPHFSRDGQILLGKRYAEKVLAKCYGKDK